MTVDLRHLPPLRDVIHENELRAEKKLGQNFLLDLNLTDKIARAAGDLQDVNAVEIGPGPGGLTRSLISGPTKSVTAIEYDPRAIKALASLVNASQGKLTLLHLDALNVDVTSLCDAPRAIVANLPYNIATPLLIGWLKQIAQDSNAYKSMTLMFQREVGERIVAKVGDKNYGRLAVISQWLCEAQLKFDVPASAFTPPPKVVSSIVHLKPKILNEAQPAFETVEKVTARAFGQRRKMIRSSLKDYREYFDEVGLDETLRAENLSVEQFVALAICVEQRR